LALPAKPVSSGYDVRVYAHGRFGNDVRTVHVVALATGSARPPVTAGHALQVSALALQNETVHGGDAIAVSYQTSATTGYVRLIDEIGTVRAEALLSPHGHSILQAPYVDTDQDLRVVVDAQAGSARAEAEAPVRILHVNSVLFGTSNGNAVAVPGIASDPADPQAPPPAGSSAVGAPPVAAADLSANPAAGADADAAVPPDDGRGIISVAPIQRVGAPIIVRIGHFEAGLRVSVMGDSGEEIEGVDVTASEGGVVLPPLSAVVPRHLSVVATYARGFGQDTYIRPIALRGR
jgi:hypothetical protein